MAAAREFSGLDRGSAALRRRRPALLRWFAAHERDLPWRRTRDPYAIWIAEVMLQQTQVATVVPYYRRFLARFPDVAALAAAEEEEVLGCWSGLGYYRRARSLHAGARRLLRDHGGRLPRDAAALRALPGVGRYTAGAIASIAFDLAEPVLDGNVRRVLARVLALRGAGVEAALWGAAAELVPGAAPGRLNQALMELGALVCTPAAPRCPRCPLRTVCRARARGQPEAFPAGRARPRPVAVRVGIAWVRRGPRVLLQRWTSGNPLRGSWDLPAVEIDAGAEPAASLRRKLLEAGLEAAVGRPLVALRHGIMRRRLTLDVLDCRLRRGRVAGRPELRWADPAELGAVSGATRKVVSALCPAGRAAEKSGTGTEP